MSRKTLQEHLEDVQEYLKNSGSKYSCTSIEKVDGRLRCNLWCPSCSVDKELYPEGIPRQYKYMVLRGKISCMCKSMAQLTKVQNEVIAKRLCESNGLVFKGFVGKYNNTKSFMHIYNPKTGNSWKTTTLDSMKTNGTGDPKEKGVNTRLPEGHYQKLFKKLYPSTTKFTLVKPIPSDPNAWLCECSLCNFKDTVNIHGVYKGNILCECGVKGSYNKNPNAYLYLVEWYGFCESYLKFGITTCIPEERFKVQYRKGKLDYRVLEIVEADKYSILSMEKKLKNLYKDSDKCPKSWLPDGYTETVKYDQHKDDILNMIADFKEQLAAK